MFISVNSIRTLSNWYAHFGAVCLLISNTAFAAPTLTQTIDNALTARCLNKERTAVNIVSLSTGRTIYSRNPQTPLLPASIMKLVTTAAALHYLGPEYRYKTKLLQTGRRIGDTLQGDLILMGSGDAKLVHTDLWQMAQQLKASGLNFIEGKLIADVSLFDNYDRAPTWDVDRSQRPFDAKIGALSLNLNTVAVNLRPGANVGDPLVIWLEPSPAYMRIDNQSTTAAKGNGTAGVRRVDDAQGGVRIVVTGNLPQGDYDRTVLVNVDNPSRYTIESFRDYLGKAGITVRGATEIVNISPNNAREVLEHESPPLSLIIKEMNTYSSNFMAEQLVKTIAVEKVGKPATHLNGLKQVADFLQTSGVSTQGVMLADGSGLSKQNQITAKMMTDLLVMMHNRFDIGPDFMTSMRVMGAFGLHSNRFKNSPAHAHVRAKTGTLNGVSTLTGYVPSNTGRQLYAFSLLLNNNGCGYKGADDVEDQIVNALFLQGDELPLVSSSQLPVTQ
ncbi:D-alanyl-D-alanine carboxypeptidase/D-alanyl-D-alanine endopeptidase [Beggiatoa leptomitoformis]|uniref:D-alanyl-D-alanine carboxypeptidase/D-alanyl-D-alanine-endopeptidase n=1 Tax=Beggiatoa leptomitoformis TaxID=288004 RepID=A0A2N9YFV2_9GAMM|nr:D-alanyl-D-alanine carboxypeptidase/D-alanyl-D-alanine-endopeptidase [Beggiatoa leptomitoformis]ALG68315.1 D-alanyl-D-alanine carboxypeptidase/D-alanyl-D-alanine-endopeptidase [Beggiatoa leptomitoformis]AUI69370.1 D-alanyl-D-alanine carboxypeptidase/D-alanyl-D-alanine-endopeptidase [Beggiatoa leptomitoformis]